jgi:hypothetical protein
MTSHEFDEQARLLRDAAENIRLADKALNQVAELSPKLCQLVESIHELDFVEPALAERVEGLAQALGAEAKPAPLGSIGTAAARFRASLAARRAAFAGAGGELRPADVSTISRMLHDLADGFDAVVAEAARAAGLTGYDRIVSETLGDGILTELDMLSEKLAENAREAALERNAPAPRVVELLSGARGEYTSRPAAPSKSRGNAPGLANAKMGK